MTDDLDKLAALLRDNTPPASNTAKMAAINAGMEAFEKNAEKFQGSPDAARLIHNRPKTGRGFLEGLKDMFKQLTGRQIMLGTASFATIALAVVITQDINFNSNTAPDVDFFGTEANISLDQRLRESNQNGANLGLAENETSFARITPQS